MSRTLRPLILGLETSCDETSAAVLDGENTILGHVILSQDEHEVFGGVVPELAARAHLQKVDLVVEETLRQAGTSLRDIDVFGVTAGPGLIGALLVGLSWSKAASFACDRPLVAVHHMEGHLFSPSLENGAAQPPFIALLVSGGHTLLVHAVKWGEYRLLGETRDDAAGEAFDKVAKLLGLGYPGGPLIERLASEGEASRYKLPRPMLRSNQKPDEAEFYDFSFSGLKTAVSELVRKLESDGVLSLEIAHVAAGFQEAAVDVLASKTMRAVGQTKCARVLVGGGVSANRRLCDELAIRLGTKGELFHASIRLSLDNAAMIARAARFRYDRGDIAQPDISASATMALPGLKQRTA